MILVIFLLCVKSKKKKNFIHLLFFRNIWTEIEKGGHCQFSFSSLRKYKYVLTFFSNLLNYKSMT